MKLTTLIAGAVVAAGLSCVGSAAQAATVVDQVNLPSPNWGLNDSYEWQQQVTVGESGLLAGIMLFGSSNSDLVRIIRGKPFANEPYLFSGTVNLSDSGTFIDTSLANINLKSGQKFFIDVSGGSALCCKLLASDSLMAPLYSGGDLYYKTPSGVILDFSQDYYHDQMAFQTYMDTSTAVPEPATWAMMLVGIGGIGGILRLHRKQVGTVATA